MSPYHSSYISLFRKNANWKCLHNHDKSSPTIVLDTIPGTDSAEATALDLLRTLMASATHAETLKDTVKAVEASGERRSLAGL